MAWDCMNYTVIIPARMASSRLPDKPLADIAGLPMVVRVAQRAAQSGAARVVVAADDPRVVQACQSHGIEALLTRQDHVSGSDRLARPVNCWACRTKRWWSMCKAMNRCCRPT